MLDKIPLGEIWQAGQNTAICRYVHTPMLPYRPAVHCPHVGPTGGDMCFDHTYESMVVDNPFPQPWGSILAPQALLTAFVFQFSPFPELDAGCPGL
ncbi:hypothetical protein B0H13DRAFT_2395015 [Mycena leptocephala]|nr:hypothetical protein B0H13DRAFT_2395015 [Mycena leptocephala]